MISRVCEEFGCLPSEALKEDARLVLTILEMRAYARTKAAVERARSVEEMPDSPMVDRVFEVVEEIRRRGRG